jgi:hypothetical protein
MVSKGMVMISELCMPVSEGEGRKGMAGWVRRGADLSE